MSGDIKEIAEKVKTKMRKEDKSFTLAYMLCNKSSFILMVTWFALFVVFSVNILIFTHKSSMLPNIVNGLLCFACFEMHFKRMRMIHKALK